MVSQDLPTTLADAFGSLDGGVRLRDGLHTPGDCDSVKPRTESMRQPDPHTDARERLVRKRSEIVAKVDQLGAHDPAEVANLGFGKRIGDATAYAVERMTDAYQARTIYATVSEIDQASGPDRRGRPTVAASPAAPRFRMSVSGRTLGRPLRSMQREAGEIEGGALNSAAGIRRAMAWT